MWRNVLGQAIRDIYGPDKDRMEVIRWIRTDDFNVVCEFADVSPTDMKDQIAALLALPKGLATKYGVMLRALIIDEE